MSAVLMCVYGVEVSQFKIINDTISSTFGFNSIAIMVLLIALIFYTSLGGVRRLANYSSLLMPPFMLLYSMVCLYIILSNYDLLPSIMYQVIVSSVQGHAPLANDYFVHYARGACPCTELTITWYKGTLL